MCEKHSAYKDQEGKSKPKCMYLHFLSVNPFQGYATQMSYKHIHAKVATKSKKAIIRAPCRRRRHLAEEQNPPQLPPLEQRYRRR